MPRPSLDHPVLRAAALWRDRCLLGEKSVFAEKSLWYPENVGHLVAYFVENPPEAEGNFFELLERQLASAPETAKQLAAEMLWVMYLFPMPISMQPGTKWQQISRVWAWSGQQLPDSSFELNEALNDGIGNPGPAFHTFRSRELRFLIQVTNVWMRLTVPEREAHLKAPWEFAKFLEGQDDTGMRQLRHILLYLLFPNHFEPFAAAAPKRDIVRSFSKHLGDNPNSYNYKDRIAIDQQILQIRKRLREEDDADPDFDFHDEPYLRIWRPDSIDSLLTPKTHKVDVESHRVWALAPGAGALHWNDFRKQGIIAIGWDDTGDLRGFDSKAKIHEKICKAYRMSNPQNIARACYDFVREMQPGDYVVAKQGLRVLLGYGIIRSDYSYELHRPDMRHVRHIEWKTTGKWHLPKKYSVPIKTLTEFTGNREWIDYVFGLMDKPEDRPRYNRQEALKDLFLNELDFNHIIDSLERKKNVILEGPPGVGKTFIAKRLAYTIIGYKVPDWVQMVQFHQSYSYEDFVQGYRPTDGGGFELRNGTFFSACRKAIDNPENRFVFIIDEVNRGNLSKIFGEIMMLVEADKRDPEYAIPLTYSPDTEPFHVPENLYIIGMMNTADRSLAMVDYALRRRFAFHRLQPAFGTDQFSNFLNKLGVSEGLVEKIVVRLSKLNAEIREDRRNLGPGFEIGHSFFCPGDDDEEPDESWYKAIVRQEIEPLLREYWFDRPDHVEARIRNLLAR